jgi:hypothetical protein
MVLSIVAAVQEELLHLVALEVPTAVAAGVVLLALLVAQDILYRAAVSSP